MLNNDRLLAQILLLGLLAACLWVLAFCVGLVLGRRAGIRQLAGDAPADPLAERQRHARGGLLTFSWMVLVAVPLVWLGFNIADQIRDANALLHDLQVEGLPPAPEWLGELPLIGDSLVNFWNTVDEQGTALIASIRPYIGQVANWLLVRSARIGGGMLELALSLVLVFFFYRDGPRLSAFVHSLLHRLIGDRADHYLELVAGTVQRVVNGVIGTAAAQAILAYIGFLIAGIPGALVLGLLTFACSFIMVPPLIWGPAVAWLAWQGDYGMAVFLGIWGMFVISGVDNVLKPYLISRGGNLPLVVVLLGVFGGILAFGFMGLFLGPTLLAVAYSLLGDWLIKEVPQMPTHESTQLPGESRESVGQRQAALTAPLRNAPARHGRRCARGRSARAL